MSENLPPVSIFITTYLSSAERGELLKGICLNALAQNYPEFEVVVSDNAGDYPAEKALAGIDDPRLKIFRNEKNMGQAGNSNMCVERCAHDIIKLNCDDDLLHPDFLRRTVPFVDDETFVVVDYEQYMIGEIPEEMGVRLSGEPNVARRGPGYGPRFWKPDYISLPGCTIFSKKLFKELGGYNRSSTLPDWDMMMEATLRKNIVHVKEILCWMGVWEDSQTVKALAEKPYFFQTGWLFTKFRFLRGDTLPSKAKGTLRRELLMQFLWQSLRPVRHPFQKNYRGDYAIFARTFLAYWHQRRDVLEERSAGKTW